MEQAPRDVAERAQTSNECRGEQMFLLNLICIAISRRIRLHLSLRGCDNKIHRGCFLFLPSGCVPEHVAARFLVHLSLEFETVLQSIGALRGRPLIDAIEPSLDVRKSAPNILAQYERQRSYPPPSGHIRDRVIAAEYEWRFAELRVEDTVVPSCLVEISIDCVIETLRREMLEMHGLS